MRTAAPPKAVRRRQSCSASRTRNARRQPRASDEALRRDDGRGRRRRQRRRPRAARPGRLVAADAAGAARDHPRRAGRSRRTAGTARDSGAVTKESRATAVFLALALVLFAALTAPITSPQATASNSTSAHARKTAVALDSFVTAPESRAV